MEASLNTENIALKDRAAFWREAICETFVELECNSISSADFHGSMLNSVMGDIQFTDVRSASHSVSRTRSTIAKSGMDYFLLSLQTKGVGVLQQDGRTAILKPGDFALYDTTRPYDLRFNEPSGQLVLRLSRSLISGRLADPERCTALRIGGDSASGRLASTFIRQLHDSLGELDPNSVTRLHASTVDLMATALAEQTGAAVHGTEWQVLLRRRILSYLDCHLANPGLNCEVVAAAHGISERYMRKVFQGSAMSVSEWIWTRRLEQARRDLSDPCLSHLGISAIGFDVGFKDTAHFSRAFKVKFGVTPSLHRETTSSPRA